jgi:restriction system protein
MRKSAPIHQAVAKVLRASGQPMTAEDIYNQIVERGFYRFLARDPLHVVESQLRRHCDNLSFPSARRKKYFTRLDGGRYALLDTPIDAEPPAYKVKARGKRSKDVIVRCRGILGGSQTEFPR